MNDLHRANSRPAKHFLDVNFDFHNRAGSDARRTGTRRSVGHCAHVVDSPDKEDMHSRPQLIEVGWSEILRCLSRHWFRQETTSEPERGGNEPLAAHDFDHPRSSIAATAFRTSSTRSAGQTRVPPACWTTTSPRPPSTTTG